jgi:M6 family metalloprotease-like protein
MKKITSLLMLAALMCFSAAASPAHRGSVQMPQPDGSMLSVCLVGDEFYHFNTTADGYTIMLNDAGAYVYAQRDGMSLEPTSLLAHDAGSRSADEQEFLATVPKRLVDETAVAQGHVRRAKRNVDLSNFDFENFRGLVILIDFSNQQFACDDPKEFYTQMFSSEGFTGYHDPITNRDVSCPGSVHDYFNDQSNGAFHPPFDVFGPYRATYGSNNTPARSNQCQSLATTIFTNALKAANEVVDFTNYDNNNDGKIDMVYFLVAGYSSSFSGNNQGYLWPHSSNLSYLNRFYDNKKIDRYACSTELYGFESSPNTITVEGIGTVAHEFSHVLGLPDFYDTDYADSGGESHHPGGWDIMADGGDYNYGRSPVGYSLYERYALGWAKPQTITESGSYTLRPVNTSREGYILRTPVNNEYFTIENRQKTGWDAYLPGHGMLVFRVDSTNTNIWNNNKVNCNPDHNYFELLRAGNTSSGDLMSDPFPGTKGNVMLTNDTEPSLLTWDGYENEFNILAISEVDNIITFNVMRENEITALVEDFETMPVSTGTTDQNVEGRFASWSFNKAGVRAPGEGRAIGEHSVLTKRPSVFYSTTPVYYNIYMASLTVFNMSSTDAKYSLEYSVENDADGNPVWVIAPSSKAPDAAEAPGKDQSTLYWMLNLDNTQPACFRIYQRSGNQNVANYVDNLTFYYTGEAGGPADHKKGDVNRDDEVNIADVNAIIDIILGNNNNPDIIQYADVNGDGEVNIADVNLVIGIILND